LSSIVASKRANGSSRINIACLGWAIAQTTFYAARELRGCDGFSTSRRGSIVGWHGRRWRRIKIAVDPAAS